MITLALLTTVSLILSYLEMILNLNFGLPGIKLGLTNIAVMLTLYRFGIKESAIVIFLRISILTLLFGNALSAFYSIAGASLALVLMVAAKKSKFISIMGISVIGGVFHNVGQLICAGIVMQSSAVIYYLPVLLVAGAVCGVIIGTVSKMVIPLLPAWLG